MTSYISFSAWWMAIIADRAFCAVFSFGLLFAIFFLAWKENRNKRLKKMLKIVGSCLPIIITATVYSCYLFGCISRLVCSNVILACFVLAMLLFIFSGKKVRGC